MSTDKERERWIWKRVKSGRDDLLVMDVSDVEPTEPRKLNFQTDLPSNWDKVPREDGIRTLYNFQEWKDNHVRNGTWKTS